MKNKQIVRELCLSYAMELETVQNYIAASVNLDGVRSDVIKKALAEFKAERPEAELYFLVGADSLRDLLTW